MDITKNRKGKIAVPKFFSVNSLCDWLEISKSTLSEAERMGLLARRIKLPNGVIGWSASQVFAWFYREVALDTFVQMEECESEFDLH